MVERFAAKDGGKKVTSDQRARCAGRNAVIPAIRRTGGWEGCKYLHVD